MQARSGIETVPGISVLLSGIYQNLSFKNILTMAKQYGKVIL